MWGKIWDQNPNSRLQNNSLGILGKDPSHDGNTPEKEFNP